MPHSIRAQWNINSLQVHRLQKQLMQKALAPWPRRDRPLLEINCGAGSFLYFYWQSGFEVVATEEDPELRIGVFDKKIPGIDLRGACDDDLPFDDDCFDWVILHIRHANNENMEKAFQEAVRVVKRGLMLTFWNKTSIAGLWTKLPVYKKVYPAESASLKDVLQMARSFSSYPVKIYSTLCLPDFTWQYGGWCQKVNGWFAEAPFGAWCIVRMVPNKTRLVTPMPLILNHEYQQAEGQLDYIQQREVKKHENSERKN